MKEIKLTLKLNPEYDSKNARWPPRDNKDWEYYLLLETGNKLFVSCYTTIGGIIKKIKEDSGEI